MDSTPLATSSSAQEVELAEISVKPAVAASPSLPDAVPDAASLPSASPLPQTSPVGTPGVDAGDLLDAAGAPGGPVKSAMPFAVFNFVNSIIGAGIIGLPFALNEAGFVAGLVLLVGITFATDYSVRLLVRLGVQHHRTDYEDLCRFAFGRVGFFIISTSMFFFAYGAQCSYLIIIGDTLSVVIEHWGDYSEDARDTIRPLAIVITSVVLVLPLSLIKDMARLGRTSFLSLLAVGWIVVIVVVRSLTGVTEDLQPTGSDEDIPVISKNFFPSIGIIAFAFVCHHSCFLVFNSLQNNTQTRWKRTTRTSLSVSLTACLLLAVAGYLTFRGRTEGDLLVNFSKTDQLMNVTRALFAVTMVLTYPMEIFVSRHSLHAMLYSGQQITHVQHVVMSLGLFLSSVGIALVTDNLGVVLELTGGGSATILGFIMPAALYFKLTGTPMKFWQQHGRVGDAFMKFLPPFALGLFGAIALVCTTATTIHSAAS